jgi:hypothetical protein
MLNERDNQRTLLESLLVSILAENCVPGALSLWVKFAAGLGGRALKRRLPRLILHIILTSEVLLRHLQFTKRLFTSDAQKCTWNGLAG